MAMQYDLEDFTNDLQTLLTGSLNTKIAALNSEKSDSTTLETIDSGAFFFQTLDERIVNYTAGVFYGINATSTGEAIGPGLIQAYEVDIYIFYGDRNVADLETRLLRYHRALIELLQDNWKQFSRKKAKIISADPAGFAQLNSTQVIRATGVTLEVVLGY